MARSAVVVAARRAVWAAPAAVAAAAVVVGSQWMGTGAPGTAAQMVHLGPRAPDQAAVVSYTVRPGDSLSRISRRFYGTTRWWPGLYEANRVVVGADPQRLDAGIVLLVPSRPDTRAKTPPRGHSHAVYRSQHATSVLPVAPRNNAGIIGGRSAAYAAPAADVRRWPRWGGGTYSYGALERIWTAAGGSAAAAPRAACIAERESTGRPGAISATDCFGLWQIMGRRDALDPATSARIAVHMSHNGSNWSPWSTSGMC